MVSPQRRKMFLVIRSIASIVCPPTHFLWLMFYSRRMALTGSLSFPEFVLIAVNLSMLLFWNSMVHDYPKDDQVAKDYKEMETILNQKNKTVAQIFCELSIMAQRPTTSMAAKQFAVNTLKEIVDLAEQKKI